MKVAYDPTLDIPFNKLKEEASKKFIDLDFSKSKNGLDIYKILTDAGEVLYIDVDLNDAYSNLQNLEQEMLDQITASLDEMDCPLPPPVFEPDALKQDLCEEQPDFPNIPQLDQTEIDQLQKELDGITDQTQTDIDKMMDCKSQMDEITSQIFQLLNKEQHVNETVVSLEELLYNYRIMYSFFKKRLDELSKLLGTFDPILVRRKDIETELENLEPTWKNAKDKYDAANSIIQSGVYTNQQYDDYKNKKAAFDNIDKQKKDLDDEKKDLTDLLEFERSKITTFNIKDLTEGSDQDRQKFLEDSINGLFLNMSNVFNDVTSFSTRTNIDPLNIGNPGQNINIKIYHDLSDKEGVLNGKEKAYLKSFDGISIQTASGQGDPHGTLYDSLYNVWGDVDRFFTKEERGLTEDSNYADASLKGTGAEVYQGSYVQDANKFREFYENFPSKWTEKVQSVKDNIIEPALMNVTKNVEILAVNEVQFLLAYGRAYQDLPAESTKLQGIVDLLTTSSNKYKKMVDDLTKDYAYVQTVHQQVLDDIESKRNEYSSLDCSSNNASAAAEGPPAGLDPLGILSLTEVDPSNPNPTKWCYWKKFALYATTVNMMPFPGNGGFRYWPIGLVIPSPNGIVKIPLPIVWIPVAVIPLQIGIFVVFIAQCGLCPSPVVFYMGPNGEKKFIISLRPVGEFGSNASVPFIKTLQKGGIAIKKKIGTMLNDVKIPSFKPSLSVDSIDSTIEEVRDKVLKKVQKLGVPDASKLNGLGTGSSIADKKTAFKKAVLDHLSKIDLTDFKIPRNGEKVNPKPTPISDIIDSIKKSSKLDLPDISISSTDNISLKDKLINLIDKVDPSSIEIKSPPVIGVPKTDDEKNKYVESVKKAFKDIAKAATELMTPLSFGILSQATAGITFINPYKCKTTVQGISTPSIPANISLGIVGLKTGIDLTVDAMDYNSISSLTGGKPINAGNIKNYLKNTLIKGLPEVNVPNPSVSSISDMMKDGALKSAKIQIPTLPDPKISLQPRITIPGSTVKSSLLKAVSSTVDSIQINDVNLEDVSNLDLKQMTLKIVEGSFDQVENMLKPFVQAASLYKSAKDKTFPEILGLSKVNVDDTEVATVSKNSFDKAIKALQKISIIPFAAVAFTPDLFRNAHPILTSDDLPPWERFTLDNFLFVIFLDEWCKAGKASSGFFENP